MNEDIIMTPGEHADMLDSMRKREKRSKPKENNQVITAGEATDEMDSTRKADNQSNEA